MNLAGVAHELLDEYTVQYLGHFGIPYPVGDRRGFVSRRTCYALLWSFMNFHYEGTPSGIVQDYMRAFMAWFWTRVEEDSISPSAALLPDFLSHYGEYQTSLDRV